MFENNRDEINFHKFLRSVRKSQGVSLEKTTFGVCTKSGMSRVESGSRLPQKLVRDRLTARLGISGEEYEEYLLPDEYRQWEHRMEIIRCINKKDVEGAEEKIAEYAKAYQRNRVERQFVYTMKFMVYQLKGCPDEKLRKQIQDALACTVPNIDAAFAGVQLLADQELNLIMEYVRLVDAPEGIEMTPTEWRLMEYHKVVSYVENSRLDKIAQAKVYSKVACFIADLILKEYSNEESLRYGLELCNRAIEVLRDTVRLYYFVELNEYRMKLIEKLCIYIDGEVAKDISDEIVDVIALVNFDETEYKANGMEYDVKTLEKIYQISKVWVDLFYELYVENELPVYMENFTHLYTETECNNALDVIRKRRAMMGVTREKLSRNACSNRTLQRMELEECNSSMSTVREVFEKIGLCAEYKRARVVTSSADVLHLLEKLIIEMNTGRYKNAYKVYMDICNKINMEIPFNEQEMKRSEALILSGLEKISKDEHYEILIDAIECTVAFDNLINEKENYLTREELLCVNNLVMLTNGAGTRRCRKYLEELCEEKVLKIESMEMSQLYTYELMMVNYIDYMGNDGKYELSRNVGRKLLKESLRNRKSIYLANCEYNELWNIQKIMESNKHPINKQYIMKSLKKGLLLSNISRKADWKDFFQQKLQVYVKITNE